MARYEHLPIYKSALDLCVYFEKIVKNFSKYNKYTIGSDLRNKSREILCKIIRINSLVDKREELQNLTLMIEELKIVIRLCNEIGGFSNLNSYAHSSKLVLNLGTQSQAWLNYEQSHFSAYQSKEICGGESKQNEPELFA